MLSIRSFNYPCKSTFFGNYCLDLPDNKSYEFCLIVYYNQMKIKSLLYGLVLIAYALSLTHSVVPHGHFDSYNDFKAGHAHKDSHEPDHHDGDGRHNERSNESPFVVTHFSNTDISVNTFALGKRTPDKIQHGSDGLIETTHLLETPFGNSVFHVPIRAPLDEYLLFSSRSLRAPPVSS